MIALLLTLATFTFCGHGHCTAPRRIYRVHCDGTVWLSPRPVKHPGIDCQNVPSFTAR